MLISDVFALHAGYSGAVEANNIIILYAQVTVSELTNRYGCWDWYDRERECVCVCVISRKSVCIVVIMYKATAQADVGFCPFQPNLPWKLFSIARYTSIAPFTLGL